LFQAAGVHKSELRNPETVAFIMSTVNNALAPPPPAMRGPPNGFPNGNGYPPPNGYNPNMGTIRGPPPGMMNGPPQPGRQPMQRSTSAPNVGGPQMADPRSMTIRRPPQPPGPGMTMRGPPAPAPPPAPKIHTSYDDLAYNHNSNDYNAPEPPPPAPPQFVQELPPPSGNDLLSQIKKGAQLKKVEAIPSLESNEGKTLADTLAMAMKQRRNDIKTEDAEENDDDWNDDDWEP